MHGKLQQFEVSSVVLKSLQALTTDVLVRRWQTPYCDVGILKLEP